MLLMSYFLLRRSAAARYAAGLFTIAIALLMITEFAVLATPPVNAQALAQGAQVVLEGRYSSEPQLLMMAVQPLDLSPIGEP